MDEASREEHLQKRAIERERFRSDAWKRLNRGEITPVEAEQDWRLSGLGPSPLFVNQEILNSVRDGIVRPDNADHWAVFTSGSPMARAPALQNPDHIELWDAPMLYAWVIWRSKQAVALHAPEGDWREFKWVEDGHGYRLIAEGAPPHMTVSSIEAGIDTWALGEIDVVETDPKRVIKSAHLNGDLKAKGRAGGQGNRITIKGTDEDDPWAIWDELIFDWNAEGVSLFWGSEDGESPTFEAWRGVAFSDLRWRRDKVVSIWPELEKPNRTRGSIKREFVAWAEARLAETGQPPIESECERWAKNEHGRSRDEVRELRANWPPHLKRSRGEKSRGA